MKKRKMHTRQLLILFLCAAAAVSILVCLSSGAAVLLISHSRRQEIFQDMEERQENLTRIDKLQNTGNISKTSYEMLRSLARNEIAQDYSVLEEYSRDKIITKAEYEKVLELTDKPGGGKYLYLLENAYQIPEEYLTFLFKDDDRVDFVLAYIEKNTYSSAPKQLSQSLKSVPLLIQWDLDWGYLNYGTSNIAFAGCAPTSMAMIISYLKQDPSVTPASLARWADLNGYYVDGAGTDNQFVIDSAQNYGLEVKSLEVSAEAIQSELSNGNLVLCNVGPGDFTTTGHFIVLTGLEGDKVVVNDPNSYKNSQKRWSLNTIVGQTKYLWSYSADKTAQNAAAAEDDLSAETEQEDPS